MVYCILVLSFVDITLPVSPRVASLGNISFLILRLEVVVNSH